MKNPYPVYELFLSPTSNDSRLGIEQMGSKRKFWVLIDKLPGRPWLFKYSRKGTGEHWSEKIASEIAPLIGLKAVRVELAEFEGHDGVIVENLIPHEIKNDSEVPIKKGELIHGNELLAGRIEVYEKTKQRFQFDHSWQNICLVFQNIVPKSDYNTVMQDVAGLLVLDALIVNTDRHHENWAVLTLPKEKILQLAPSYDHASSLGRELTDKKRINLLKNKIVGQYVKKANGAIYGESSSKHPDNPLEFVKWAVSQNYAWFKPWLEAVEKIAAKEYDSIVDRVPKRIMTDPAKRMVLAVLEYTSTFLKELIV